MIKRTLFTFILVISIISFVFFLFINFTEDYTNKYISINLNENSEWQINYPEEMKTSKVKLRIILNEIQIGIIDFEEQIFMLEELLLDYEGSPDKVVEYRNVIINSANIRDELLKERIIVLTLLRQ